MYTSTKFTAWWIFISIFPRFRNYQYPRSLYCTILHLAPIAKNCHHFIFHHRLVLAVIWALNFGIVLYVIFCIWFLELSIISVKFIYVINSSSYHCQWYFYYMKLLKFYFILITVNRNCVCQFGALIYCYEHSDFWCMYIYIFVQWAVELMDRRHRYIQFEYILTVFLSGCINL